MALPGETIGLGAKPYCPDCGKKLELEVCRSGAGYYIGTQCCCGPYSRESVEYWPEYALASLALARNRWTPRG